MEKTLSRKIIVSMLGSTLLMTSIAFAQSRTESETETTQTTTTTSKVPEEGEQRKAGGLFIEPMLIAGREDSELKTSQLPIITDDTSGKLDSAGVGLRGGVHLAEVLFLAADGRYMRSNFRDSFYDSATMTGANYGLTLGAQTPFWGIRLWGTAVLGGDMDPGAGANDLDLKFNGARGNRAGIGFHIAAVAINVEYEDLTYGSTTVQSLGSLNVNDSVNVDFVQRGTNVSLSFPMEL